MADDDAMWSATNEPVIVVPLRSSGARTGAAGSGWALWLRRIHFHPQARKFDRFGRD
jgi:hypothetical protein